MGGGDFLAIAKLIVEMHGAQIWIIASLGKGSMFQPELPVHAALRKREP
jgi:signal transduction histidine kinase